MKVHLRKKKLKDDSHSLYLDFYIKGKRNREYLGIFIEGKGNDSKEKLRLAQTIRAQREIELISLGTNVVPSHKKKSDVVKYFREYAKTSPRKSPKAFEATLIHLIAYYSDRILASDVDEKFCQGFRNYLSKKCNGETPHVYYCVFKQVISAMTKDRIFPINPANDIRNPSPPINQLRKEVLNSDEMVLLHNTYLKNREVKRAFLFSCFTGMSLHELRAMKWKMIDFKNKQIFWKRAKTQSQFIIPLNESAISLLEAEGPPEGHVFKLPSQPAIGSSLKTWTTRAKIKKHITFHCARHSYATGILRYGGDLVTTSKLLGHTSTRLTQKYTHVAEEMKRKAVDSLPKLA